MYYRTGDLFREEDRVISVGGAMPSTFLQGAFEMTTMLVTGGAGFIGSHLCASFLKREDVDTLIIVDNLHPYYDPAWKQARVDALSASDSDKLRFFQLDILNTAAMHQMFQKEQPEAVIHLAAIPGVRGSLVDPLTYVDIDVKGTVQMLELAREYRSARFLFASSSSVYGERAVTHPCKEEEVTLSVASPYAVSKLSAEMFCRTYAELYGLAVTCLRFFTVYGPGQRPDMAISRFFQKLQSNQSLPLYDVSSMRDYTYIDDIVRGIEAALDRMDGFHVYNLGSGKPTALLELVRAIEQVTGKEAGIHVIGAQPGDVSGTWADTSAARGSLDWLPEVSLQEGLRRYYDWLVTR